MSFEEFSKIARLSRNCVITEKIDGTNAQVYIVDRPNLGGEIEDWNSDEAPYVMAEKNGMGIFAGSRNRWLQPGKSDNFGFAAWVQANADALFGLGYGRHFGEWWGSGVQRWYGLEKGEKRFSLFNVSRWSDSALRPACCLVVPLLYAGEFNTAEVDRIVLWLAAEGSQAAPGFAKPEGVVVWHEAARQMFKKTIEKDEEPKGLRQSA